MAAHNLDDVFRAVELQQEQYLRSLRTLHEQLHQQNHQPQTTTTTTISSTVRRRERADSRITANDGSFTPPLRAMTGPTFTSADGSSLLHPSQTMSLPARRSTLDAERQSMYPSPRLMAMLGEQAQGNGPVGRDEDVQYLPLLESPPSGQQQLPNKARSVSIQQDETPRSTTPLTPMSWTEDQLLDHIRNADLGPALTQLLEDQNRRGADVDTALSFRDFASPEREDFTSANFETFDINAEAVLTKTSPDLESPTGVGLGLGYGGDTPMNGQDVPCDASLLWETIKDINLDGNSVGRMTIVQEPTPLMLAALHLVMGQHFDMNEVMQHLLSDGPNRNRTKACVQRAFERAPTAVSPSPAEPFYLANGREPSTTRPNGMKQGPNGYHGPSPSPSPIPNALSPASPNSAIPLPLTTEFNIRQHSYFFVFKYYTVVHPDFAPSPWQKFDKRPASHRLGDDHVDIAECGSILALSLSGKPAREIRQKPRRGARRGVLFDSFASWHLLSLQSFPDDCHTERADEWKAKGFWSGPFAFLDALVMEFKDAGKRNMRLHEDITKLITPPTDFMFNRRLRDKLLFEDKHFTYIRRYFWAYNTLAVINTGIASMLLSYHETFTPLFWSNSDPQHIQHLWEIPSELGEEGRKLYLEKLDGLRRELEKAVGELEGVRKMNERTRKEIENLREQLFSGSSIKESRRAIDQGDDIRLLTTISIVFLPSTFVTSVWGMNEFTTKPSHFSFPVTLLCVSIPFIILVMLLQTRIFSKGVRWVGHNVRALFDSDSPPGVVVGGTQEGPPHRGRRRAQVVEKAREWRWSWRGLWKGEEGRGEKMDKGQVLP